LQLVNTTVEDVSLKEHLPYDVVLGVIERRIAAQVDWTRYSELGILGLDEIALKKGHRDFVVIVTARLPNGHIAILGVLSDREKITVAQFLHSLPPVLAATIHTACIDMYESYLQAVREVLPHVRLVIDRFHLAQKYRDAADTVRKQELKRLKHELPKTEYQRLKGSLWAFRKNQADLAPEEQERLARLFAYSPELEAAHLLREELTAIFEQATGPTQGQEQIRAWQERVRHSGLSCFDDFLNTLDRWWNEITNYFVNRNSSGFVEGLNNKLKVLKRRCYGLLNVAHLFQRIFLDLEGYGLFTPHATRFALYHGNSQ
jgi:transposase